MLKYVTYTANQPTTDPFKANVSAHYPLKTDGVDVSGNGNDLIFRQGNNNILPSMSTVELGPFGQPGVFDIREGYRKYARSTPNAAGLMDFGAGDWTIEFFIKPFNRPPVYALDNTRLVLLERWSSPGGVDTWEWTVYLSKKPDGREYFGITLYDTARNPVDVEVPHEIVTGFWHHLAVVRASNNILFFDNGELVGSGVYNPALFHSNNIYLILGIDHITAHPYAYFNEVRVTKGVPRYVASFDPLVGPFPTT